MNLYLVIDNDRWGRSISLIRAESEDEAEKLAGVHNPGSPRNQIIQLVPEGDAKVLWQDDVSPDTPRD